MTEGYRRAPAERALKKIELGLAKLRARHPQYTIGLGPGWRNSWSSPSSPRIPKTMDAEVEEGLEKNKSLG